MANSTTFPMIAAGYTDRARVHDRILLVLVATFFAAGWALPAFFAAFNAGGLVAGAVLALWMHWMHVTRPGAVDLAGPGSRRTAEINFASIPVGSDAGGLICVVGGAAILLFGVPGLAWFLAAALVAGVLVAGALAAWHTTHQTDSGGRTFLGRA
jgi:hypothetical protein